MELKSGRHTPVMQQFFRAKEQYPDAILFFRMGDFYEMFFDDAVRGVAAARPDADLAQQGRRRRPIPMAGVPHHAATATSRACSSWATRSRSASRWPTRRRSRASSRARWCASITPGLVLDADALDARAHNYLAAVVLERRARVGAGRRSSCRPASCAAARSTSGASALAELVRLEPREVLVVRDRRALAERCCGALLPRCAVRTPRRAQPTRGRGAARACSAPRRASARSARSARPRCCAAALALAYARRSAARRARSASQRIERLRPVATSSRSTRRRVRNLELVAHARRASARARCSGCSTRRCTPMGARLLRRRLLAPLTDVARDPPPPRRGRGVR